MLSPFARFNETIARCYRLVDHHKTQCRIGRPGQHLADVLRGTIVLACAALDALNEELLVGALPKAQQRGLLAGARPSKRASRDLVAELGRAAGPQLGTRARKHLRWMTLQSPDMIEEMLTNVLGASSPWGTAASELARDTGRTWTADDVRARLDTLVKRRNEIAHKGDLKPSGGSQSIRRARVEVDILLTHEVGRAIRDVIRVRL